MIYEFAVDPKLFQRCGERRYYRFFCQAFGLGTTRCVASIPSRKRFEKAVKEVIGSMNGKPHTRATEIWTRVRKSLVHRPRLADDNNSWLEEARAANREWPLHAIVSPNEKNMEPFLVDVESDEEVEKVWYTKTGVLVSRTPKALAACLAPLLQTSKRITFVDPFFTAGNKKYLLTFSELFKTIFDRTLGVPEITIVCALNRSGQEEKSLFQKICQRELAPLIPTGGMATVIRLEEHTDKDKLHNRFVLTNLGGVIIGWGLGVEDNGPIVPNEKDDVNLLSLEQFQEHSLRFSRINESLVESKFEVVGSR